MPAVPIRCILTRALLQSLLILYCPLTLFCQPRYSKDSLTAAIERQGVAYQQEPFFYKAQFFYLKKNWDSALVYSMKQLSVNTHAELAVYCHYFRAVSFKYKKLYAEAKEEFNSIPGSFRFYYAVMSHLYEIALEQEDFEGARHYMTEIDKMPDRGLIDFRKSAFYHNAGLHYLHMGKYDTAELYLSRSMRLQEAEKDTAGLIATYMDIGNVYYDQYRDKEAIPYFEKAYLLSKQIHNIEMKKNAAENMAVVEENRKNFTTALAYRKEFEGWKDSLNDQHKVWAIAELEKEFAVQQKQKEVDVLEAVQRVRIAERNGFIYASVLLALLLAAGIYFYRQQLRQNRIINAQRKELAELNAAKNRLFSIVSHDLRSSVTALKTSNARLTETAATGNMEELAQLLQANSAVAGSTYNLLDNLLHWALLQTQQSYFKQEPLRLYFIVEQTAFNYKPLMAAKHLIFENRVGRDIMVYADQESLKIVLRNLLDNAIKFSPEHGHIIMYTRAGNATDCELVIEDEGPGMPEPIRQELLKDSVILSGKISESVKGTGLGLQLCKMMIHKNNGQLGIENREPAGTRFIIVLPKPTTDG